MYKRIKQVAYRIEDATFSFLIMQTDAGWWRDSKIVLQVIAGIKEEKNLIETLKYAGITKKQWRVFIQIHPAFDQWRREYRWRLQHGEHFPLLSTPTEAPIPSIVPEPKIYVPLVSKMEGLPSQTSKERAIATIPQSRSLVLYRKPKRPISYPHVPRIIYLPSHLDCEKYWRGLEAVRIFKGVFLRASRPYKEIRVAKILYNFPPENYFKQNPELRMVAPQQVDPLILQLSEQRACARACQRELNKGLKIEQDRESRIIPIR